MKEKIEHLGADLVESEWAVHIAPSVSFMGKSDGKERPSAYSFLTASSLAKAPLMHDLGPKKGLFVTPHNPSEEIRTWGVYEVIRAALTLSAKGQVEEYINAVKKILKEFIRLREGGLSLYDEDCPESMKAYVSRIKSNVEKAKLHLSNLTTQDSTNDAVNFLIELSQLAFESAEKPLPVIGIIFAFNKRLKSCSNLPVQVSPLSFDGGTRIAEQTYYVSSEPEDDSNWFYNELLHGLYVPSPSRASLESAFTSMMSATRNCPERRVPIYDCHGKIYWPK